LPRPAFGDFFARSVYKLALAGAQRSAVAFVGGNRSRPHDLDLFRWPVPPEAHNALEVWQPRLQGDQLCSYAIWSVEDAGPARNLARWRSFNVWWDGRQAVLFSLDELFDPNAPWQDFVRSVCRKRLTSGGESIPAHTPSAELRLEAFALSETGLELYFDDAAMNGRRTGGTMVPIEYSRLRPFFARAGPAAALREQRRLSSAR
jgi:hypothetical protein